MNVEEQIEKKTISSPQDDAADNVENNADEGEFKLTVRKLEMPVRPRGVLAE